MIRNPLRRLLVARDVTFGEPGDVEVGECAEDMGNRKRGFVREINGDVAVMTLGNDTREIVPLASLRAVKQRAKGPDSRSGR